jgi:voltage-gated potassium channel
MQTWERRTEWPLAVGAVFFLAAYAWPILEPDLASSWVGLCRGVTWIVWGAFGVDYLVRLTLARDRRRWFLRHLFDLVVLALPLLRPLRLLRLVVLLRFLNRSVASGLRGRVAIYVAAGSLLLAFVAALAVLDAERGNTGSNIVDFKDALWWSCTTMTT